MDSKQYILKEILSEAELEFFLRLRYNGFCNSAASLVVSENNNALDINYYDRNSLHYGIYTRHDSQGEPVAYFSVLEQPTIADDWVENISQKAGLADLTCRKPPSIFPCLAVYPDNSLEQNFYKRKASLEKAGEVSRFIVIES